MSSFSAANLVRSVAEARFGTLGRAISEIEQKAISFEGARTFTERVGPARSHQPCWRRRCYRPAVLSATQRALQLASMSEVHPFTMRR